MFQLINVSIAGFFFFLMFLVARVTRWMDTNLSSKVWVNKSPWLRSLRMDILLWDTAEFKGEKSHSLLLFLLCPTSVFCIDFILTHTLSTQGLRLLPTFLHMMLAISDNLDRLPPSLPTVASGKHLRVALICWGLCHAIMPQSVTVAGEMRYSNWADWIMVWLYEPYDWPAQKESSGGGGKNCDG